jgi:hypothetical protein
MIRRVLLLLCLAVMVQAAIGQSAHAAAPIVKHKHGRKVVDRWASKTGRYRCIKLNRKLHGKRIFCKRRPVKVVQRWRSKSGTFACVRYNQRVRHGKGAGHTMRCTRLIRRIRVNGCSLYSRVRPGKGSLGIYGPNPGRIKIQVRRVAKATSSVIGVRLVGSDGSSHSKYTTSGYVSDHWTGHAIDLPAAGRRLTCMGRAALIAVGVPFRKAVHVRGGLFTVWFSGVRYQVIFNTMQGGNHWNHLHLGAR